MHRHVVDEIIRFFRAVSKGSVVVFYVEVVDVVIRIVRNGIGWIFVFDIALEITGFATFSVAFRTDTYFLITATFVAGFAAAFVVTAESAFLQEIIPELLGIENRVFAGILLGFLDKA